MSSTENPSTESTENRRDGSALPKHPAASKLPIPLLRRIDVIVTIVQAVALSVAYFSSDGVRNVVAIGCVAVFFAGAALFSWAFLVAAGRSRLENLTVAGAFFLAGSVAASERRWAFGLLAAQTLIGFVGAGADPYTTMAFGILVPMFGLGVIAFLGSAHGAFHQRNQIK